MDPAALVALIAQDENQRLEFKLESEKQADLAEVLMAFANAEGGHLLVGVSDDGEVVGVEQVKAIVDRLHTAARRIEPSLHHVVTVQQVDCNGKFVVVAQVPDNLTATYGLAGRFKIREGSYNRQMNSADVVAHAVRRGTLDYERTPVRQATLNDLDEQKVKDFLIKRLRTSVPDRPLHQLLQNMGAVTLAAEESWQPTVAGLLFFGAWPQFMLNHATILAARLVGPQGIQIIDRATMEGTLPEMIDRAVQFVQRNTRHGLQIGNRQTARAQEVDEYPLAAVREAITNACCHRDYQDRTPIQLKIYDDRLVLGNPGGLLPGLEVTKLEGKHKTRNPLLADWLHALGYIERFGIGILRMQAAMREAGLPAPQFHNTSEWFEVTLWGPSAVLAPAATTRPSDVAATPALAGTSTASLLRSRPWYTQVWSASGYQ